MYRDRDRERHQEIRKLNPDGKHCPFLLASPLACLELPAIPMAGERAGRVCPNNPYENHRELLEQDEKYSGLLAQAFYLEDRRRLGMLPGVAELSPEEFLAAVVMRSYTERNASRASQAGMLSIFQPSE